mmetsp:Transcript_49345/g.116620  ORF Transcript_49345/g.116620 Transcript_49345/m.116620 type:complete len:249 (-) Transcript_49345:128-874(-)
MEDMVLLRVDGDVDAACRVVTRVMKDRTFDPLWEEESSHSSDMNEEERAEDLRLGAEAAERVPDRFPWQNETREEAAREKLQTYWDNATEAQQARAERIADNWQKKDLELDQLEPDTQIFYAALWGDCARIESLVATYGPYILQVEQQRKDAKGWTPLHAAAARNQTRAISTLARLGARIDARSMEGVTPLHVAAHFDTQKAIEALLALGANVLAKDRNDCTPLEYAMVREHIGSVELLVQHIGYGEP